jgi:hypothetical protein
MTRIVFVGALANLEVHDSALVAHLCQEASRKVADFAPHTMSAILGALAKLGMYDEALVNKWMEVTDSPVWQWCHGEDDGL